MTFNDWYYYFEANRTHFDSLHFPGCQELTDEEKKLVAPSLAVFQLGEHSEGRNLIEFAEQAGDSDYLRTIRLFIKEEQRHSGVLGKFMDQEGIKRLKSNWTDSIFRFLRKPAGLELSITVLTTAEIVADTYYKALMRATESVTLMSICNQILKDETMHLNFQAFTLKAFYKNRSSLGKKVFRYGHRFLMAATTQVVWFSHRKVLKAGGFNYSSFNRSIFEEFSRVEYMITGRLPIYARPVHWDMRVMPEPHFI